MAFNFPKFRLDEYLDLHFLTGTIRISRATQGMLVHACFQSALTMQCVRCLKDYDQPLETTFDELFSFPNYSPGESGLILPDTGNIELQPLVREYLLLEVPYKPLCKPDCAGLCAVCGMDLNLSTCEHHQTTKREETNETTSRWHVLCKLQTNQS